MENYFFLGDMYNDGMPLGLTANLARNFAARERFSALSEIQRAKLVEESRGIRSDDEMRAFVENYQNWSFQ